ncbi:MAG TPA: CHRD domain-containing protein [Stellaceae bacterium]|nr:CHRD domain-containing protein [Stellaceae bacterium]
MSGKPYGMLLAGAIAGLSAGFAQAQEFGARLNGFEELGALNAQTGAILSGGKGKHSLDVDPTQITYRLTYSGLRAPVTQAHIHFGKIHVAGGVMVFFCTNLGNGPAGTPTCPANGGTVTGTWTAASVVGPASQNVPPGSFDAVVSALNSNTAYANIHTTKFPAGEIRGQVRRGDRDDD